MRFEYRLRFSDYVRFTHTLSRRSSDRRTEEGAVIGIVQQIREMATRRKKRRARDPQQREEATRRMDFAHQQRIARRANSALTLIRLEKRALLGRTDWMHIGNPPEGWSVFVERLARARGTRRFAEWWRDWILALDPKTCPVDDRNYGPLHVGLSITSCTNLFESQSWAHDWLADHDEQRDLIDRLRVHLSAARDVSQQLRLYFPVFRRGKSYDENPIRASIAEALDELESRAELFGYTRPRGTTVGRRGKAAADSRAAARGYIVRELASFIRAARRLSERHSSRMYWSARDTEPRQLVKMCKRFFERRASSNSGRCLTHFC